MPLSLDELSDLASDDVRPPSQQIAALLRAAIRTGKVEPGERLPSQNDLAERFGVARETIKSALRVLREERLIVTRQGSGMFVRAQTERPVGLRPHVEAAFEQRVVSIDFAGYSSETLHGVLTEPLDKVRNGRLAPESISIRILLPDLASPMALPSRVGPGDDAAVRDRMKRIRDRSLDGIFDAVEELASLSLVGAVNVQVRTYATSPLFKLYILNEAEAFFGFYPVVTHTVAIDGEPTAIYDPMGKDAAMFHFSDSDDTPLAEYVDEARTWFDSIWETVAKASR